MIVPNIGRLWTRSMVVRLSRNLPGKAMFIKVSNKRYGYRHRIRFLNPDGPSIRFEALSKQNLIKT
jgi:hypothetical protein